uniref:BTB domain-containing protein n=1 Tax=Xiphophorus couchianus TaxID=32473 RepID=A0A3B5MCU5_9TELE
NPPPWFNTADITASHQNNLLKQLNEQRRQELFCDCSVLVEGQLFRAHRNVLFASSGYFRMLLSQGPDGLQSTLQNKKGGKRKSTPQNKKGWKIKSTLQNKKRQENTPLSMLILKNIILAFFQIFIVLRSCKIFLYQ